MEEGHAKKENHRDVQYTSTDPMGLENKEDLAPSVEDLCQPTEELIRQLLPKIREQITLSAALCAVVIQIKCALPRHTKNKTWFLRWLATPVAYLFPKADREEWLGDLYEMHYELIEQEHYPYWIVNAITAAKTLILVWSAVEVRVLDLVSRIRGVS